MNKIIYINTERSHIFSPDIHVGVCAKVNRVFENKEIENAVARLQQRHPLLTATVGFDKDNVAYYKLNTSKPIAPVFITADDDSIWKEWMDNENRKLFNLSEGSLMKILVVKASERTTIAALGHHLLGDGLSFIYFMQDLLKALDNMLDDDVLTPPVIQDESAMPKGARLRLLSKLTAKLLGYAYRKKGKRFNRNDYAAIFDANRNTRKPAMDFFVLDVKETKTLIENCRIHNVTVNEAIATAFFAARKHLGGMTDFLGVSCNVRSEMTTNPGKSMGNFVSGIKVNAIYDESLNFWQNVKIVGDLLNKKLKNTASRWLAVSFFNALDGTLQDALNFVNYGEYFNPVAKKLCDSICGVPNDEGLGISNLGKQDVAFILFRRTNFTSFLHCFL